MVLPPSDLYHVGLIVEDLAATAAALDTAGCRQEGRASGDDLAVFAHCLDSTGVRIEIVDGAMFPDWPGFLAAMTT